MSRHAASARPASPVRSAHLGAGLVAAAAVALGLGLAPRGLAGLVGAVALVQALLVWAWTMGTAVPGKIGGLALGLSTAAAADALLVTHERDGLGPLVWVFALLLPAMLLHQLARGVVRVRLTESLSGIALQCTTVMAAAAYLSGDDLAHRVQAVALAAAAVAVLIAHVVDAVVPMPQFAEAVFSGIAGIGAGAVAAAVVALVRLSGVDGVGHLGAALFGASLAVPVGLVGVGTAYLAQTVRPRNTPFAPLTVPVLQVLLPVSITAPVAHLLGMVVTS